ncbi:MAG: hypothetical protein JNJ99_14340, partial [Crocinitomicaceae bacterium]|nr:hypothetical protein [Crocinitomicaceae bacterium]
MKILISDNHDSVSDWILELRQHHADWQIEWQNLTETMGGRRSDDQFNLLILSEHSDHGINQSIISKYTQSGCKVLLLISDFDEQKLANYYAKGLADYQFPFSVQTIKLKLNRIAECLSA